MVIKGSCSTRTPGILVHLVTWDTWSGPGHPLFWDTCSAATPGQLGHLIIKIPAVEVCRSTPGPRGLQVRIKTCSAGCPIETPPPLPGFHNRYSRKSVRMPVQRPKEGLIQILTCGFSHLYLMICCYLQERTHIFNCILFFQ